MIVASHPSVKFCLLVILGYVPLWDNASPLGKLSVLFSVFINHSIIIELFELEGTLKDHLVQLPCNEQRHLQLDQVAHSTIQPHLKCVQGLGFYYPSGQPVPVLYPYHVTLFFSHLTEFPPLLV